MPLQIQQNPDMDLTLLRNVKMEIKDLAFQNPDKSNHKQIPTVKELQR